MMNAKDHFNELQKYSDYRPTGFDCKGLAADKHDISSFRVLLGQNRDSGCLDRSNFNCALELLGGESDNVQVHRFGHWACGYFELLLISNNAPDDIKKSAGDIACSLADYPVLNTEDFSEMEMNEAGEIWANCYDEQERIDYIRDNRSQFEFHSFVDMRKCIRGEFFCGYANELIY